MESRARRKPGCITVWEESLWHGGIFGISHASQRARQADFIEKPPKYQRSPILIKVDLNPLFLYFEVGKEEIKLNLP